MEWRMNDGMEGGESRMNWLTQCCQNSCTLGGLWNHTTLTQDCMMNTVVKLAWKSIEGASCQKDIRGRLGCMEREIGESIGALADCSLIRATTSCSAWNWWKQRNATGYTHDNVHVVMSVFYRVERLLFSELVQAV